MKETLFLIDSQADITILKISALPQGTTINNNEIVNMTGITREKIQSLGTANIAFKIKHLVIEHKIHIVSDDFNMPSHGIIGKDFLRRHKCLLDYADMTNRILHVIDVSSDSD